MFRNFYFNTDVAYRTIYIHVGTTDLHLYWEVGYSLSGLCYKNKPICNSEVCHPRCVLKL